MDLNADDSSLLLRFQRSLSLDPDEYPISIGCNKKRLFRSTMLSVLFAIFGWYYPRYLIAHETTIANKQAPYQETSTGDVLLDFLLNQPLVDPPTIPGTCDTMIACDGLL
jgi:hypothetical protein